MGKEKEPSKEKKKKAPRVIGRRDKIDLPELDLSDVDAKVDTGAYTSSLHVRGIRQIERDGQQWVRFKLKHPSHPAYTNKKYEFPVYAFKRIRSSFGKSEKRFIIRTPMVIFGKSYITEFSLTDRSRMECPVLIGRKFLYRKFVVDVVQKDLSYTQKIKDLPHSER